MKLLALANVVASLFVVDQLDGQTHFAISLDSIRIAFEVHGNGNPALIFVHGWSCDRSYWMNQVGTFSKNFKVVTIDLGGHGESGLGRKSWTMEAFGSDVTAVIKKFALKKAMVGHSMGGESMEHYGVQVMIMNGVGHFMMMEEPDRFNRLLKTAIDKLSQ